MGITPGRYRDYDDHTVECLHCTADSNGTVALIPGTTIEAHELWHAGPPSQRAVNPLAGGWPTMVPDRLATALGLAQAALTEDRIPELSDEQLTAWAEEAWGQAHRPDAEHDDWVEAYLRVGRMLSGKVIR